MVPRTRMPCPEAISKCVMIPVSILVQGSYQKVQTAAIVPRRGTVQFVQLANQMKANVLMASKWIVNFSNRP